MTESVALSAAPAHRTPWETLIQRVGRSFVELGGICSKSPATSKSPARSGCRTRWSVSAEQPAEQRNWVMLRAIHPRQPCPTAWDAASASCSQYVSDFGVDSSERLSGELVIVDVGQPEDVGGRRRTRGRLDEYALNMFLDRITVDPERMNGRPCVRDLRVTVATVLGQLAAGQTREQILADYPYLEDEDITASLEYGAARVSEREVQVARPA